jgi:hypothetical protein
LALVSQTGIKNNTRKFLSELPRIWCKFVTDYRTISLSQMSKGEPACTLPWQEIVGEANFKRDFLKVVDFVD